MTSRPNSIINKNHPYFQQIKQIRSSLTLPLFLNEVLIGLILGDGHLYRSSPSSNTRLELSFKGDYLNYANYIYGFFIYYIGTGPRKVDTTSSTGLRSAELKKIYPSIRLKTLSLPLFNQYYNLFYY